MSASMAKAKRAATVPLGEVRRHDCLGLLRGAMCHVGAAAQTLAAVRALSYRTGETFAAVKLVADRACLSTRTTERHLERLVQLNWLRKVGREHRRTCTYQVPDDVRNQDDDKRFAKLPRWAAWMLPTVGERFIFALIVSRDELIETALQDDPQCESYMRSMYSVAILAKDCGLSRRTINMAKEALNQRGLIRVNGGDLPTYYRDHLGRCHSFADSLSLNHDFPVPEYLIHRCAKVADSNPFSNPSRSANVVVVPCKSDGDLAQKCGGLSAKVADTQRKSGGRNDIKPLDHDLNKILVQAPPPTPSFDGGRAAAAEVRKWVEEKTQEEIHDDLRRSIEHKASVVNLEERKRFAASVLSAYMMHEQPAAALNCD
jgi:hypothetical protein